MRFLDGSNCIINPQSHLLNVSPFVWKYPKVVLPIPFGVRLAVGVGVGVGTQWPCGI